MEKSSFNRKKQRYWKNQVEWKNEPEQKNELHCENPTQLGKSKWLGKGNVYWKEEYFWQNNITWKFHCYLEKSILLFKRRVIRLCDVTDVSEKSAESDISE